MKSFLTVSVLIILLAVALYAHTLSYGYVYLDDTLLLEQSATFLKDPRNIGRIFTQEVFTSANRGDGIFYRPILTLSFFLDTQLFGTSLIGYRISNLVLHIISAIGIYLVLRQFGQRHTVAGTFAVVFSIHPMLVQAVAWVPGRNDQLMTIWVLAACFSYLRFMVTYKQRYLLIHALCFSIALFTKETALLLPLLCWAYSSIHRLKISLPFTKGEDRWGWSLLTVLLVWIIPMMSFLVLRHIIITNPNSYSLADMVGNVVMQLPGILMYIGKAIVPLSLSVYPDVAQGSILTGLGVIVLLTILLWFSKTKRSGVILFGIVWFLLFLLPTMTIRDTYSSGILREHRMYLPMLGLFLILGEIEWVKHLSLKQTRTWGTVTVILIVFFIRAWLHTSVFADSRSFWTNAVQTSPMIPVVHLNLGAVYAQEGEWESAERAYQTALSLRPDIAGGHNNLGVLYLQRRDFIRATSEFEKELHYHPDFAMAIRNLERVKQESTASGFHP